MRCALLRLSKRLKIRRRIRGKNRSLTVAARSIATLLLLVATARGQEAAPPPTSAAQVAERAAGEVAAEPAPTPPAPRDHEASAPEQAAEPVDHYLRPKAAGAWNETDPPGYVKPLSEHKLLHLDDVDWLDFGIEHRTRFEYRDDDLRRAALIRDEQFLLRSRVYVGVRQALDPFRFAIEFQDARQFLSRFDESDSDVDEADFLQAYGELFFDDVFGPGQPFRFQAGRMSFDYVDRKLVGRNRWRNTTNAFDGFRMQLGQRSGPWQLDVFAAQPVQRRLRQPDHPNEERMFYGVVGAWRQWSEYVTIEPYYFVLDEDRKGRDTIDREIHTLAVHVYGPIHETRFDYDTDLSFQFGEDGKRKHRAFAFDGELGYTFDHAWKPRLSVAGTYATGDHDPADHLAERFDRLFAPNHFRSTTDYLTWQNSIAAKLRFEFQPTKKLRLDAGYGAHWLASDSDTFGATPRRDRAGRSGDFAGQEIEVRARYRLVDYAEIETGYSHFLPGDFIGHTGPGDDSDFFYVQTTVALP